MNTLLVWIKKLPNYVGVFGIWAGVLLLLQVERRVPAKSTHSRLYQVPNYFGPVRLRDTVADHSAFWICLVAEQYNIKKFPQSLRLREEYQRIVAAGRRPLIIDAGANIGMSTLWLARAYPEAIVVAVEPDPDNYALLAENTRALGTRVVTLRGGVWPRSCDLVIENPDSGSQYFRVREASTDAPGAMRAYTFAEVLAKAGADEIIMAKIDIEGAQAALFEENTGWVDNTHLIILELDDWQFPWAGTSRSFFSCLSRYRFDYLLDGENVFCFHDRSSGSDTDGADRRRC